MKSEFTPTNIRLSVIIPCFNHGQYIMEAIASAESCQRKIYEIIIVNDGSTDQFTCDILSELKQKNYTVIDQVNQGVSAARNTAIKIAKGEYILPLDADNRIRPDYIDKGIKILDQFPDVGVVYGNAEYFGDQTGHWEVGEFNLSKLILANYIDVCAVFRKSIWENCGYYDTNLLGYEDWDLWLSAAKRGWRFYHIPEVLFNYRVRPGSLFATCKLPENNQRLCEYITAKHADIVRGELVRLAAELETLRSHYLYKFYQKFLNGRFGKVWRAWKLQVKALLKVISLPVFIKIVK